MLALSSEKLELLSASHTTREIKQQPELWKETYQIYSDKHKEIEEFLIGITQKHTRIRIILTGAGTSAYVGETITPYLKEKVDEQKWEVHSIPTTSLVSNPYQYFKKDIPTLLISFARSGNSPESLAAVQIAEQIISDLYQITITCASEGKLAQRAKNSQNNLLLLMPERSNDKGFAMTGSFSCMTLMALLIFDTLSAEEKEKIVQQACRMGESVVERESAIQQIIDKDYERIIYLGSGSLEGLSREAQLKVLELTAGEVATAYDSPLGFRHGPKSFVNERTLIFVFISNHPYTRQYDLDIVEELRADNIAAYIGSIEVDGKMNGDGDKFIFPSEGSILPDAYLVLPYIMVGQTISLLASIKAGNQPDTPSPTGTVNRVVQGVTIYDFEN